MGDVVDHPARGQQGQATGTGTTRQEEARSGPLSRARRALRVLELRQAGLTEQAIADAINSTGQYKPVTPQGVSHIIRAELAKLEAARAELGDQVRDLELARLDQLLRAIWPKALSGNLGATDRAMKLIALRARLAGVDASAGSEKESGDTNVNVFIDARELKDAEQTFVRGGDQHPVIDVPPIDVKALTGG